MSMSTSMSILLTVFVTLVTGMLFGVALERWWPQFQRKVDALNDYWIGAEICDAGNLLLGVILISSPWVFEFDTGVQSQNQFATGIVVTSLSIASFVGFAVWEEWGNLMAGLWLVVSPWILNFNGSTKWYQVAIGIVIAAFAKNELWFRSAAVRNSGGEAGATLAPNKR
jgi:hypothetical protein